MRRMLFRLPLFRAIVPRVPRPILPFYTSRLSSTSESTRALTGALRISPFRTIHTTSIRLSSSSSSSSSIPPPSPGGEEGGSLSQRFKSLMKAYGWYAVGVYFVISTVDFAFAFVGIKLLGAEYVSSVVASAKVWLFSLLYSRPPEPGREEMEDAARNAAATNGQEGLYAMLVLAYIMHKAFLPIRVAFTAAFTPRIVRWLHTKGWAGGEGPRRAIQDMRERLKDRD